MVEGANKRLDIVYWWLFNYNQGKTVAGTSWGNHVSDWEHVKVKLDRVDFSNPQNEVVVGVMYDHHGDQDNFKPGDGNTEFSGRQVLVHLANGDHEAYAKAGVYDRPMGTHDYCKENAYRFDQRAGDGRDLPVERLRLFSNASWGDPELQGSRMAHLSRPLGKPRARQLGWAGFRARVRPRGTVPARRIRAPASAELSVRPPWR